MGVPIEDEVNEVFWWCRVYIHTLWNIATGKTSEYRLLYARAYGKNPK